MSTQDNPYDGQQRPRFVQLIRRRLLILVFGVAGLIASLGYIGLEKVYENANQNLEQAVRDRYRAEVQHIVEAVAATIESAVAESIGPELSPDLQDKIKNMVRGAKFIEENPKSNVWKGCVFLYDMAGTLIAHGDMRYQHKEGQNLLDWKDEDGVPLVKQLRDKSLQGGGFAEYRWEKCNEQGGSFHKISYAKKLRGDKWWLGTGVYVDDIERTLQAEQTKQRDQKSWAMGIAAFVLLVMLAAAYLVSAGLAKRVTRPIDQLVEGVQRVSLGDYMHPVALANGTDETQVLGDVFNHMQAKIIAQVSALTTALGRIRELTSNEWEMVEEERRRISRDLHDDIKQKLWILRTKLDVVQMTKESQAQQALLSQAIDVIKNMSQSVSAILQNLRPPALDELGLLPALRALCESQAHSAGLTVHVEFQGEELQLASNVEIMVYRIVQEAMMNVARHAQAHHVEVWLTCYEEILEVGVQDDGRGFNVEASMHHAGKGQSMGLLNMTERIRSIDGEIVFECPPTGGTTVTVRIPLSH